jgi:hypothetical protein
VQRVIDGQAEGAQFLSAVRFVARDADTGVSRRVLGHGQSGKDERGEREGDAHEIAGLAARYARPNQSLVIRAPTAAEHEQQL